MEKREEKEYEKGRKLPKERSTVNIHKKAGKEKDVKYCKKMKKEGKKESPTPEKEKKEGRIENLAPERERTKLYRKERKKKRRKERRKKELAPPQRVTQTGNGF